MHNVNPMRLFAVFGWSILLMGIGPFSCENSAVNTANERTLVQLKTPVVVKEPPAEAQKAGVDSESGDVADGESVPGKIPPGVAALAETHLDQPEVYLARGFAYMASQNWSEAKKAFDHAYALVAQAEAQENTKPESERDRDGALRRTRLRSRISFALGRVAVAESRYDDAIIEFGRALDHDPNDEDARWNLELAWHMKNPSCAKRDDDHEPDNESQLAKPYDPEKGSERLLCPGNEDWYSVVVENAGGGVFATVNAELVKLDGDETRTPELQMVGPEGSGIRTKAVEKEGVWKVGVRNTATPGDFRFGFLGPGSGEMKYDVSIDQIPPCSGLDDDHEPDNSPLEAKPIAQGQNKDRILCPGNQDWYTISGERNMDLYIRVSGEITEYLGTEKRQPKLGFLMPSYERPERIVDLVDGELRLGYQGLPEDGEYVFAIAGPGDGEWKYSLDIVVTPPCPVDDAREENDEPRQAYTLKDETPPDPQQQPPEGGEPKAFEGMVGNLKACPGDADFFRLDIPADTEVQLSALFDAKRAPLSLKHHPDDGAEMKSSPNKEGLALSFPKSDSPQSVLISVETVSDDENNYMLRWAPPQPEGDDDQQQKQQPENQDQDDANQPQESEQPQGVSGDELLDALDEQSRNPQLEKALRERAVLPDLEDY